MAKRACVFVDGENFRYAINDLFEGEFSKRDYLPKRAEWARLFDWMVELPDITGIPDVRAHRFRTYWYVIQYLDFYPYKFPDVDTRVQTCIKLLSQHRQFSQELSQVMSDETSLRTKIIEIVEELKRLRETIQKRFEGWITMQNAISTRHSAVEFRRAGAISYNLFRQQFGREKAVDVKLATDLIVLRDIYDIAVIVSGDQDYVPAVHTVKDYGKRVVNVAFKTRDGKLLPGGARRLNNVTDSSFVVPYADFRSFLNLGTERPLPLRETSRG